MTLELLTPLKGYSYQDYANSFMTPTLKINITGIVQGVGFRPHVYRCAQKYNIKGYVRNNGQGVEIHAQADCGGSIDDFIQTLKTSSPPLAKIENISLTPTYTDPYKNFNIVSSQDNGQRGHVIPPDAFVCDPCLEELFNPTDRRYLYPFINCMHCGPRYTIVNDIPYDRPKTTMHEFKMCPECQKEYDNPADRRFHAQPTACPQCGPSMQIYDQNLNIINCDNHIEKAVELLKSGHILAVKGIGGYHLMIDPYNTETLEKLRARKKRDEKPFCLLFESITTCERYCELSNYEKKLLTSPARPIVIAAKSKTEDLSPLVAPKNTNFGVMLAYTPIHYLMLRNHFPCLICTSANITDKPIIYEDDLESLLSVADYAITHNRKIQMFTDDSIVRAINTPTQKTSQLIRRSKGYVPNILTCHNKNIEILSVGAELKNTVCTVKDGNIMLSQYIGDLKNLETTHAFKKVISHVKKLYNFDPKYIACDLHPDLMSSTYARDSQIPQIKVQHHHAHMCACMIENHIKPNQKVIGVIFDGMGYGADGQAWGGEFLVGDYKTCTRGGHFNYFPLPGSDAGRKKIDILAFACLLEAFGNTDTLLTQWQTQLTENEMYLYEKMINKKINSPLTSSVGRLFDAVSAISGICHFSSFEGQAAIQLEQSINIPHYDINAAYPFTIQKINDQHIIFLKEMFVVMLNEKNTTNNPSEIAWKFHNTLIKIILETCLLLREQEFTNIIALSGGCFQNRFLLESTIDILSKNHFNFIFHSDYPSNDGVIALGQAAHVIYSSELYF